MNRFAYLASGQVIRFLSGLSSARVDLHGAENIPQGSIIFVINHFTRIETVLMPYHIYGLTRVPVWSLADPTLFEGPIGGFLDSIGVVSTRNPHRDQLMVKSLLTGEANWIIYPEGQMVKDKEVVEKSRFLGSSARRKPHTGAAVLALRTEFYRQRLRRMAESNPDEARRLQDLFRIDDLEPVLARSTWIMPVNLTYYPLRARDNALSLLATRLVKDISPRAVEELMTEGTMLLSGVDIDIRFGSPIPIKECLDCSPIEQDIFAQRRIDFDDRIASRPRMRHVADELMEQYMAAIYRLTTVNQDHLFASMLREAPFSRMDEENLKRRVFLVTTENLPQMGVHLHRSLESSQVSLLTDDRFNKYRDFMTLALEKGIVTRTGKRLRRDTARFSTAMGFGRARLDQPVAVIANEVVPLTQLQRRIRAIAWLPPFQLRRRIVEHLRRKEEKDFAADYVEFYRKGESHPPEVGAPLLFKGRSRELGVVLIHGFLAAPLEVKELAEYLSKRGLWVHAPRLKGHGTSPEDLATRTHQEWQESVEESYAILSNICRRVVVGGFSFGGGLALDLAARVHEVAGAFAVCPPMRLQDISSRFAPAVEFWNRLMDRVHSSENRLEFAEISPEHPHINYRRIPIDRVQELERFMKALAAKLPAIKTPALVIQAKGDPVVDPRGSQRLFSRLGSADKAYRLLDFNRHGIISGEGAGKVHGLIGDFIEKIRHGRG